MYIISVGILLTARYFLSSQEMIGKQLLKTTIYKSTKLYCIKKPWQADIYAINILIFQLFHFVISLSLQKRLFIFSSPKPKAQVSFSDHWQIVSVVCRSRRHKLSHFFTFQIKENGLRPYWERKFKFRQKRVTDSVWIWYCYADYCFGERCGP